jgi:hypothetical protein
MRKPLKVAAWASLFLACAGVGAYIAAHSDPFPPGVDRPGASPAGSVTPSGSPVPQVQRWEGVIRTVSRHEFYVGGACRSRWRTSVRFRIDDSGAVDGLAVSHVVGGARCDFPEVQVQSRMIRSTVSGDYSPTGVITLVFGRPRMTPAGSGDLGGFLTFLEIPRLACQTLDGDTADTAFDKQRDDGDRGTYRFTGTVSLHCLGNCKPVEGP